MDRSEPSDFTFCKVTSPLDDGPLESPKPIPSIKDMTLEDKSSDGVSTSRRDDLISDTNSPSDLAPQDERSSFQCDVCNKFRVDSKLVESAAPSNVQSVDLTLQQNRSMKKPVVRAKVPFEKGHSQMDWLKLTRTDPDLAGLKGQPNRRLISMDEVKEHKSDGSIWTVLKGRVYNISPYMKFHPGGADMLVKAAGKDCTSLFNKYHAWVNAEFLLEKCLVGFLDSN